MKKVRFIHAADIHLGSALSVGGEYNQEIADHIDNAIYKTFTRVFDQALEREVDFVLLAGDLYDQESRSVKANKFFNEQCLRLAEKDIPVFLVAGNHDPLVGYYNILDMPDNVHLFQENQPETKKVYDQDGELIVAIAGVSYKNRAESRKIHLGYDSIPGVWNIGILHSQLENDNKNYIPSSLQELLDMEDFHYWALGHIHKYRLLHKSRDRAVVFPGVPQGRDMGEEGLGGAVLVDLIPGAEPEIEFLNLSSIVYQRIEVPIDSIKSGNISDIQNLITDISHELLDSNFHLDITDYNYIDGYIVDWILIGRGEISNLLDEKKDEVISFLIDALRQKLIKSSPFIWTRKVFDRTGSPLDDYIIHNNPVFNDIDKITMLLKENIEFQEELLEELGDIWTKDINHEELDYTQFELTDELLKAILEQARQNILEEILERRDLS
ncbi:MAG: exonuclease SbcCD subunit D [Halanaerobiales bacterium]